MNSENINQQNINQRNQYQINRAKEYLVNHNSKNGEEPSLEWYIISDLLRILTNNTDLLANLCEPDPVQETINEAREYHLAEAIKKKSILGV